MPNCQTCTSPNDCSQCNSGYILVSNNACILNTSLPLGAPLNYPQSNSSFSMGNNNKTESNSASGQANNDNDTIQYNKQSNSQKLSNKAIKFNNQLLFY